MIAPTYKARLIFAARAPGLLNWESPTHSWTLPSGHQAELRARPDGPLAEATEYHIDIGGFTSAEQACATGEQLRAAVRLANAVLGLGLNIPTITQESPRARVSAEHKEKVRREYGATIVDCVFGLNVLREDEALEAVVKGYITTRPKDSGYVLDTAAQLWGLEDSLDDASIIACELLNTAARDPSARSAFLVSFLALDVLLERRQRPEETQQVLGALRKTIDDSHLPDSEKNRLRSRIGDLQHTSLTAEIDRFVAAGSNADMIVQGEPLATFLSACTDLRHRLAHPPKPGAGALPVSEAELNKRRAGLREIVLNLVWARNGLPDVRIDYPGDVFHLSDMKFTFL